MTSLHDQLCKLYDLLLVAGLFPWPAVGDADVSILSPLCSAMSIGVAGGVTESYLYDADGERVVKVAAA